MKPIGIKLYSAYTCDCGEENFVYPPTEKITKCEECEEENELTFSGMVFVETWKEEKGDNYISEQWMGSAGIPICNFCIARDFDSQAPIEEGWLVKGNEKFHYYCACEECRKEKGFESVSREEIRNITNGLFTKAEEMAEEYRAMLQAQIENDRLNYGEEYVLKEYYGYTEEDL